MDRKEARSFLTLYSYRPLDSRRIWSDATEHSDTRARLNLIKPDKFSNSGRAAPILIRAMNINSRRWLTWRDMFDRILAPLVSFLSPPKIEGYSTKCQRSRFVSCLTFLFFAIRQVEEDENWIQALFFIPFLSLPPSNSLILDRASFESRLSTIPGHRADSIRSESKQNPWTQRGGSRMCRATINKARGSAPVIPPLLTPPHTLLMKFPAMFTERGRRIDDDGN